MPKFQWPVDHKNYGGAFIGQPFGGHNREYTPLLGHPGIDFMAFKGVPVFAVCDGWLYESLETPDGYGIHIKLWYEENGRQFIVPHGHFLKSVFPYRLLGFIKQIPVRRGQLVGWCDSTGFSNADHVHIGKYEFLNNHLLNADNGYGGAIDFTADLLPAEDFIAMNIQFVHKTGTGEYGFLEITPFTEIYYRGTDENDIKFQAKKFGVQITKSDGSIDFSLAKDITI